MNILYRYRKWDTKSKRVNSNTYFPHIYVCIYFPEVDGIFVDPETPVPNRNTAVYLLAKT